MFLHGWSTSRPGNTTSRSQVRKLMQSKESTPYIVRRDCIQHDTVFVAAIRPLKFGSNNPIPTQPDNEKEMRVIAPLGQTDESSICPRQFASEPERQVE